MKIEEFKAAFQGLGIEIYDGIPVRDVFISIGNCMVSMTNCMTKMQCRIVELEVHNKSMEERLRDYLETALIREDAANQRADKAEKRRLPHWTDMPRT